MYLLGKTACLQIGFLSPSLPCTTEIFLQKAKIDMLKANNILEHIELNKKMSKKLLTNFLCSFQIRKDSMSDIGTLMK